MPAHFFVPLNRPRDGCHPTGLMQQKAREAAAFPILRFKLDGRGRIAPLVEDSWPVPTNPLYV